MLFKIATWNVNSLRVRLPYVLEWLKEYKPDVLALQELKIPTDDFPYEEIQQAGYAAAVNGQKTYNGVAILSRQPAANVIMDIPGFDDPQRRFLAATVGDVRIIDLYVPNGQSVGSDKYQYKLDWLQQFTAFLQKELNTHPQLVVLGDFNIAPEEIDVYDPRQWEGQVLFSEPERAALRDIMAVGFNDCFRTLAPEDKSFTWWDYRLNAFKRDMGLRIDHIFASKSLAAQCVKCLIDKTPRGGERPSDHVPVIAEFSLKKS